MEYSDLHIHTSYTKGNCITDIKELVKKASSYNMKALAITDSGSISGFSEFYRTCKEYNIKPILGCGFYFAPLGYQIKETHHLVLLAKNKTGYFNLLKLDEFSKTSGLGEKPRVDITTIKRNSEGLIALTGGLGGVFDKPFIAGNKSLALDNIKDLKDIFKSDLYFEIQDNELELNRLIRDEIIKQSELLGVKKVVSGGSFYLNRGDYKECNILRRSNGNRELEGSGFYFKSPNEIFEKFNGLDVGIENCDRILESIESYSI